MEVIAVLSGVKLLIDIFDDNWTGVATGILLGGSELYAIGDSVYYLFDTDGNKIGTKDISGIKTVSLSMISLKNKSEVEIGLRKISSGGGFDKKDNNIGFTKY